MSQSMVLEVLDRHYTKSNIKKYRKTVTIVSSENDLIEVMKKNTPWVFIFYQRLLVKKEEL